MVNVRFAQVLWCIEARVRFECCASSAALRAEGSDGLGGYHIYMVWDGVAVDGFFWFFYNFCCLLKKIIYLCKPFLYACVTNTK